MVCFKYKTGITFQVVPVLIYKKPPVGRVVLARLAGFEPATYRFVAGHSIH